MNIVGLNFAGFFQRGTLNKPGEEKCDFEMTVLDYNPKTNIFVAKGTDQFGSSSIAGKVASFSTKTEGPLPIFPLFMQKCYPETPQDFPKEFFGGIETIPYEPNRNSPMFRTWNYFGDVKVFADFIKCQGIYVPANSHQTNTGFFELIARTQK